LAIYSKDTQKNYGRIHQEDNNFSRQSLSRTFVASTEDNRQDNGNEFNPNTSLDNSFNNNRSIMSTITDLKKKWDSVLNRRKNENTSLSPNISQTKINSSSTRDNTLNNKLDEIKNKYKNKLYK
jgi:hypothetical protein